MKQQRLETVEDLSRVGASLLALKTRFQIWLLRLQCKWPICPAVSSKHWTLHRKSFNLKVRLKSLGCINYTIQVFAKTKPSCQYYFFTFVAPANGAVINISNRPWNDSYHTILLLFFLVYVWQTADTVSLKPSYSRRASLWNCTCHNKANHDFVPYILVLMWELWVTTWWIETLDILDKLKWKILVVIKRVMTSSSKDSLYVFNLNLIEQHSCSS